MLKTGKSESWIYGGTNHFLCSFKNYFKIKSFLKSSGKNGIHSHSVKC